MWHAQGVAEWESQTVGRGPAGGKGWQNGKITYPLRFFFQRPFDPPPSPLLPYMVSFHHVFMFFSELVIKKDLPKTSK